jgi:putative FmdB family regulatory protein
MPTYTYRCDKCEITFEIFHSMSETVDSCEKCSSPVTKVISNALNIKRNNNFGKDKPGKIVKQYIKDVREEIRHEKKKMKDQEYKVK